MRLNKKGWGAFQMAWMMGIILFFFLLAIILIYKYYHAMGYQIIDKNVVTNKSHKEMIDDLNMAAERYTNHYYANVKNMSEIRLSANKLFQVGLFAKDLYGDCTGYAIAKKNDGIVKTEAYIKCSDYKSPGYDKNS